MRARYADRDLTAVGTGVEHRLDFAEALAGNLHGRVGHHAEKVVATHANDQVIGAKMGADRAHHVLQQGVTGGVALRVVDGLQADNIDVRGGEESRRSARAIDLVLELGQPGRARARPGELVGRGRGQLLQQCGAVDQGLQPVPGRSLAVAGRLLAVFRGARSELSCPTTVSSGSGPAHLSTRRVVCAGVTGQQSFVLRQFLVSQSGGLVARQRCTIASLRNGVPHRGRIDTILGDPAASPGTSIAKFAGEVAAVTAMTDVVITCCLIAVGRRLVSVGRLRGAARRRLIRIRQGLITIHKGLSVCSRGPARAATGRFRTADRNSHSSLSALLWDAGIP